MKHIIIDIDYHFRGMSADSKITDEWMAQQNLWEQVGYLAYFAIIRKDRLSWWTYHLHHK